MTERRRQRGGRDGGETKWIRRSIVRSCHCFLFGIRLLQVYSRSSMALIHHADVCCVLCACVSLSLEASRALPVHARLLYSLSFSSARTLRVLRDFSVRVRV